MNEIELRGRVNRMRSYNYKRRMVEKFNLGTNRKEFVTGLTIILGGTEWILLSCHDGMDCVLTQCRRVRPS